MFDWNGVSILGHGNTKRFREFIESWFSAEGAINKYIYLDSIYERMRFTDKCIHGQFPIRDRIR